MAGTLQSMLGDGVNLPHDLLPDDTVVIYEPSGKAVHEIDFDDPDDEFASDSRDRERYVNLALTHYNAKNRTQYKEVGVADYRWCLHGEFGETNWIHCGFTAALGTDVDNESSAKYFVAELQVECGGKEVVISCRIVNGLKTTGCEDCDTCMCRPCNSSGWDMECGFDPSGGDMGADDTKSLEDDPSLSEYSNFLAGGVTLSEKARLRLPFPLIALAYYQKKHVWQRVKLVDALPLCALVDTEFVVHCNFIARQEASADDVSNKLFFAELYKPKDKWVVTACRIVHGCKTTAGCHICTGRQGKRVIHPTRGFRFGLHCPADRRLRRRR